MNIDIHGHYTTAPPQLMQWRNRQIKTYEESGGRVAASDLVIGDDEIRTSIEQGQLLIQRERDTDLQIISPMAVGMGHHFGDEETSRTWSGVANDLIKRVCDLFPENFVGVGMLPQSPGKPPANCIPELRRCIEELDFVGVNINPDPSDGWWSGPALTDRDFYPLYEVLCEYDVPAMVHVSGTCNPNFQTSGSHYLNGDTTAFVQFAMSNLFKDFPDLRFVIPHGGGAIPYHWGRIRGICLDQGLPLLEDIVLNNVFFDTCVYWQIGFQCLLDSIPKENILYTSEMLGAIRGRVPETGRYFDDTKYFLDQVTNITDKERRLILEENALRVYPRISSVLASRGVNIA